MGRVAELDEHEVEEHWYHSRIQTLLRCRNQAQTLRKYMRIQRSTTPSWYGVYHKHVQTDRRLTWARGK